MTSQSATRRASIPDEEFAERASKVQELVRERGLDALLVNGNEAEFANVRYLSDYWPVFESAGVLVPSTGELTLLIGAESETYACGRSRIPRIRMLAAYRESADPEYPDMDISSYAEVFDEAGVGAPARLGIAGSFGTNMVMLEDLRACFPSAELVRCDDILTTLRMDKSENELECLRESFRIAELAIDAILEDLQPGMTELEVVGIAQGVMYANGAEFEGMPQYVLSGPNTRHAISRPTHRILEAGDVVQLNISARVSGYSSGVGRPVCLGKLSPHKREVVEFCLGVHRELLGWLHAGVEAAMIADRFHQYYLDRGHQDYFLYGPLHGLGLMEVEAPWVETSSAFQLSSGATLQVDNFALSPEIGVRWENGVRILPTGVEMFSERHTEVIEL